MQRRVGCLVDTEMSEFGDVVILLVTALKVFRAWTVGQNHGLQLDYTPLIHLHEYK